MVIAYFNILFIVLAAICNAVMDTVDYYYFKSIFKKLCKTEKSAIWWGVDEGWRNKYVGREFSNGRIKWHFLRMTFNKPVQLCDAWHFFKMLMIIFICLSIITYGPVFASNAINKDWISSILQFVFIGLIWNLTFNLFFNKILKTK